MSFFSDQFSNVVEWEEFNDETLFWKWSNREIKSGSKLIIRPGQDAIFLFNGKVEGIFTDEGSFDIESEIVPFLSTLKGFRFGFNTGMRAEVLFVNTKELTIKWGTKNAINLPAPNLPGGMPIRCFGTFNCKVDDYMVLIDKIAGVKQQFTINDIKDRVMSMLDQLLMKWISREGKDMFNLQANSFDIGKGIMEDLDMEMRKIGIQITGFNIASFSYPPEVREMQEKMAGQSMIGEVGRYTQVSAADSMTEGGSGAIAGDMMGMQMGMMMGQQMMNQMKEQGTFTDPKQNPQQVVQQPNEELPSEAPNFCPNCGTKTEGANFCSNCGQKLVK